MSNNPFVPAMTPSVTIFVVMATLLFAIMAYDVSSETLYIETNNNVQR